MFAARNMMFVMGVAATTPPPSGTAFLSLTWDHNAEVEDGYRLRYRPAGSGSYTLGTTTGMDAASGSITGLEFGTNYDVTVAAYNTFGEYAQIGPITRYTPPEFAPTSLSATATLSTSITVGFTPSSGVTSYQGYYRAGTSGTWLVGPAITSGTSINFPGLTSSTAYQFMVRGFFANADPQTHSYSPDSATVSASTVEISLGWNGERSIATIGDTVVNTAGTLVLAVALGSTTDRIINGVTFDGQNTIGGLSLYGYDPNFYKKGGLGSDFTAALQNIAYSSASSASITFTGLVIGDSYILQVFSSDDRDAFSGRSQSFAIAGHTSEAMTTGNSFASICLFVASATSHTLVIDDPDGAGSIQLQAFQLRKI